MRRAWIQGGLVAAFFAVFLAAPTLVVVVRAGDIAAYGVKSYKVDCSALSASYSGIRCSKKHGIDSCFRALEEVLECDSFVNGVTDEVATAVKNVAVLSWAVAAITGTAFVLDVVRLAVPVLSGIPVFLRLISAFVAIMVGINVNIAENRLTHGNLSSSNQESAPGAGALAVLVVPVLSLFVDGI